MSPTQFRIDDGPHNMDGLRLYAQDGTEQVEAFIGRKVMDAWAESAEHRGGRQSLFRHVQPPASLCRGSGLGHHGKWRSSKSK